MLEMFYPDEYKESVDDIDFSMYFDQGIRGIIADIDNTFVPHGSPADKHAVEVFKKIHGLGIKTCLISNNDEDRVKPFAVDVNSLYIYKAGKPSAKSYMKAMSMMDTDIDSTLFIGDQIFTDIWGANRTGLKSIMVKKIDPREEVQIVLKRIPEKFVLWRWRRKKLRQK